MCSKHYSRFKKYGRDYSAYNDYHRGERFHPLYHSWKGMKKRCYCKKDTSYPHYGGAGIKVCERWLDRDNGFKNFVKDMGDRPDGCSLDRIDPNGDYEPSNCRWATFRVQTLNRKNKKKDPYIYNSYNGKYKIIVRANGHAHTKVVDTIEEARKVRDSFLEKYVGYVPNFA